MLRGIEMNERSPMVKSRGLIISPRKAARFGFKFIDDKSIPNNTGFHKMEAKILLLIFSHLNEKELLSNVCGVCRHWYNVARDPKLWKELEFKGEKLDTITMCNFLWKSRDLEKLTLSDMENPATVIRQMCRCNYRSLKHLKMKNCGGGKTEKVPETVLRNVLYSCRNLESLNLNGTQFLSTRFYHELSNLPNLRKLNLRKSKYLRAKDLVTVALNCRLLEDISVTGAESDLNSLQISDQDTIFFFKNLSSTLKRVDFDTTGLTGPSFEAILGCTNLERLSLRHALFLTGDIFRKHVSNLRRLKQLRLTQACQLVSEDFVSLCKTPVFDPLNLIDLSGCGRVSDIGLRSLLLRCKDGLTYLNIKSCRSIRDLNFIVQNCSKLQYLNIAHSFSPDAIRLDNLPLKIHTLNKLVIDPKILSDNDLVSLQTRAPKLNLIRSMSEFHKNEVPVCLVKDGS